jgi:hypothetical protein
MSRKSESVYSLAIIASWVLTIVLAIPLSVEITQRIESKYFPVVTSFQILEAVITPESTTITGSMIKLRKYCKFVELNAYSGSTYLNIEYKDRSPSSSDKTTSRAEGFQHWGPWVLSPTTDKVKIQVRHRCHPFWDTITLVADNIDLKGL